MLLPDLINDRSVRAGNVMRPDPSLANIHEEVAGSSIDEKLDTLDNKAARDVKRI